MNFKLCQHNSYSRNNTSHSRPAAMSPNKHMKISCSNNYRFQLPISPCLPGPLEYTPNKHKTLILETDSRSQSKSNWSTRLHREITKEPLKCHYVLLPNLKVTWVNSANLAKLSHYVLLPNFQHSSIVTIIQQN